MKKLKILSLVMSVLLIAAISGGCANSKTNEAQKTLVVANWKGYGSDTAYAVETFEKANNCKVVHQYFNSNDELMNMLQQGGIGKIDVMLPNIGYMQRVVKNGFAQPLDISKLDNYNNLIEKMRDHKDLKDSSGKIYGIPWVWGTTALGYNTAIIKEKPTSVSILWDKKYKGQIAFNDDYTTAILTAAMYLKSKDPYNPDLNAVKKALIEVKNNSRVLWGTYDDFSKAYTSGSIVAGNLWSGSATELAAKGENIGYIYPSEGAIEWQDNWCIAKNAPNKELAYKWLNWMTSKEFLSKYCADLAAQPPAPANKKVLDSLSVKIKKSLWIYPDLPNNMIMQRSLSDETNEKWMELWNEVKAS